MIFYPTPRQLETLQMLVNGLQRDEIAAQMVVTPTAVSKSLERIRLKLRASTTAHAVALALRERLIRLPEG